MSFLTEVCPVSDFDNLVCSNGLIDHVVILTDIVLFPISAIEISCSIAAFD